MINIIMYVNLVFNILFTIFVGYLLYSICRKNETKVVKNDKVDKKKIQENQDYRRKQFMKWILIILILAGLGFWIYKSIRDIVKNIKERRAKQKDKEKVEDKTDSD